MAADSPSTDLLVHSRYRTRTLVRSLRQALAKYGAIERTAWHTGEWLHMRTPSNQHHPDPIDVSGRYARETVPSYPVDADSPPAEFGPAGDINPVLTAADVTDFGRTDCVADPFLFVTETGNWHLFFEVYTHNREPTAAIAHAESDDGYDWTYDRVVLETDEHLSYPYVFRWEGDHYMIPDRWAKELGPAPVTLYRAESFPRAWTPVADLVEPSTSLHDFSVFRWEDRWWGILGDGTDLYAYYSDDLESPGWTPHKRNPIVRNRPKAARPGGRPLVFEDRILAFYQDCANRYGEQVNAYEITELSPTTYEDRPRGDGPAVAPPGGIGWNSGAMHQIDPWFDGEGWHCAVDGTLGLGYRLLGEHHWAIGIYRA